ncbi:MAG: GNAT family N-acetyltransferase [Dinoroseobacter sp.]|nr:GNAT family N-acetyltransferase [Dinoroseobacter sp.]
MSEIWTAIDATWAPAAYHTCGPVVLREGIGGGQRVSAATTEAGCTDVDIAAAAQAMRDLGQVPLFMVRGDQPDFDKQLSRLGFMIKDPVVVLDGLLEGAVMEPPPPVSAFPIWPPLQIMKELWAAGGIGAARLDVMARSADPKTAFLGRVEDRAAGCAFISMLGDLAVIHAVEVLSAYRRKGVAQNMVRGAANWAKTQGATRMATLVTKANRPSLALFTSLGLSPVEQYHYRVLGEEAQTE